MHYLRMILLVAVLSLAPARFLDISFVAYGDETSVAPIAAEEKQWASIKSLPTPKRLRAFIRRYPKSPHRMEAETKLRELQSNASVRINASSGGYGSGGGSGGGGGSGNGGSGGGGGGGGGGGWSDKRLKTDVVFVGATDIGLRLYRFRYVWGGEVYVGVMAQDLLTQGRSDAVVTMPNSFMMVDYTRLGIRMAKYSDWQRQGLAAVIQQSE